jgi:nucleotide-binding universal stress UspA family protein
MKILIAYDGSSYADVAIDDLQWAGLPQDADVVILSVVEWPLQAPRSWGMVETGFSVELEEHVKAAERLAERARRRLHGYFPNWRIQTAASPAGHAATAILEKANAWSADLIVAGTHGRSGLARVFLGSVSMKLVREAPCSVRIGRARHGDGPVRLLIGDDGSAEAEVALAEMMHRKWPAGTEVRVLAVHELLVTTNAESLAINPGLYDKINEDEHFRLKDLIKRDAEKLHQAGLTVLPILEEGDPKESLLRQARTWGASTIFIGARGLGRVERVLLGSVSSATVTHAPCTVEVVRGR